MFVRRCFNDTRVSVLIFFSFSILKKKKSLNYKFPPIIWTWITSEVSSRAVLIKHFEFIDDTDIFAWNISKYDNKPISAWCGRYMECELQSSIQIEQKSWRRLDCFYWRAYKKALFWLISYRYPLLIFDHDMQTSVLFLLRIQRGTALTLGCCGPSRVPLLLSKLYLHWGQPSMKQHLGPGNTTVISYSLRRPLKRSAEHRLRTQYKSSER